MNSLPEHLCLFSIHSTAKWVSVMRGTYVTAYTSVLWRLTRLLLVLLSQMNERTSVNPWPSTPFLCFAEPIAFSAEIIPRTKSPKVTKLPFLQHKILTLQVKKPFYFCLSFSPHTLLASFSLTIQSSKWALVVHAGKACTVCGLCGGTEVLCATHINVELPEWQQLSSVQGSDTKSLPRRWL